MPWTTIAAVLDVTGQTVTDTDLRIASHMIDTKAGTSEDLPEDAITARDRKRLAKATAWQAMHVATTPGLLTEREASTQVSGSGTSDKRDSITAVMYHPLAMLELNGLSWNGTRTEVVPPRIEAFRNTNFLNEQSDDYGTWKPVP